MAPAMIGLDRLIPHYEWRYLHGGRVAHALRVAGDAVAVCGVDNGWWGWWYGTGTQDEYERVAQLPRCQRCVKIGGRWLWSDPVPAVS